MLINDVKCDVRREKCTTCSTYIILLIYLSSGHLHIYALSFISISRRVHWPGAYVRRPSSERARSIKRLGLSSDREWFRTVNNFSDWRENGQETYQDCPEIHVMTYEISQTTGHNIGGNDLYHSLFLV